jgi:hypothetical protein
MRQRLLIIASEDGALPVAAPYAVAERGPRQQIVRYARTTAQSEEPRMHASCDCNPLTVG